MVYTAGLANDLDIEYVAITDTKHIAICASAAIDLGTDVILHVVTDTNIGVTDDGAITHSALSIIIEYAVDANIANKNYFENVTLYIIDFAKNTDN